MIRVFEEEDSTIADLYNSISHKVETEHGKEYAIVTDEDTKVLGYNSVDDVAEYNEISYVMRHKTDKQMYKITVEDGKSVTVTEDHSIIIDRDGSIHEITPVELLEDDLIISV
jgi:intein/homing endonuclease